MNNNYQHLQSYGMNQPSYYNNLNSVCKQNEQMKLNEASMEGNSNKLKAFKPPSTSKIYPPLSK